MAIIQKLDIVHRSSLSAIAIAITPIIGHSYNDNDDDNQHSLSLSSSAEYKMMSVLPLPLGQDSPMSIKHIAPANQFHSQNTNNPLQSAHNDRCSVATDGGGHDDGDIEMRPLDDSHPPSSACTLFPALSLFLFHFR